jgi:hypothetical protein
MSRGIGRAVRRRSYGSRLVSTVDVEQWEARQARLREEIDREYPAAWIPERVGEELLGTVVDVRANVPTKHGPVPVVELALPNGERRSVWLTHTVLRRAFARQNVALGETVLIRYRGRVAPTSGAPEYADYRVVVDRPRPVGTVDWKAIGDAHGDQLDSDDVQHVRVDEGEPRLDSTADAFDTCGSCGYVRGEHAPNCPNDIPF